MKNIEDALKRYKYSAINERVETDDFSLYYRVTKRYLQGEIKETIEIASIDVHKEGQGIFRTLVEDIESLAKKYNKHVYVECIHNQILIDMFKRRDYTFKDEDIGAPSCFKEFKSTPKPKTKMKL